MKTLFFTFTSLFLLVFCAPPEQEQAQQEARQQELQSQVAESSEIFNDGLAKLLDAYFELKDALVETDAESAAGLAEVLPETISGIDSSDLNAENQAIWNQLGETISAQSNQIVDETDVEQQRFHFESLSEAMIETVETFKPVGYAVYHQSCPMVRGGSADWLSRDRRIANPYHGDRMLRCGEVIKQI